MPSPKSSVAVLAAGIEQGRANDASDDRHQKLRLPWNRQTYLGSVIFNFGAFLLPALYSTLSKLWVANIDSSQVVTTDVYTYIGVIAQVLNDGLPRSAWLIVGDKSTRTISSRLTLSYTMIVVQVGLGTLMTVIFLATSDKLAAAFVPEAVRQSSLTYVRISSVEALSSAMETVVSSCTRALDHPDVPLLISSTKFVINIILDLLIISKFHVGSFTPTVNTQAWIRLACDLTSATCGLMYFLYITFKLLHQLEQSKVKVSFSAFQTLARPSIYTFTESAIRNAIYLWIVSRIILLGENYATAWGIFNTIRWGLVMVPVQAFEASTLTFVGHNWGIWRARVGVHLRRPRASKADIIEIIRPALVSCSIVTVAEVVLCIALSTRGIQSFAYYLSNSEVVAEITQMMWKAIDWTYIFYALNYQLAAILLAASPRWYLYQALGSNFLWMLPWAIVVTKISFPQATVWTYYAIIFGGALVFDFVDVSITLLIWAFRLSRGKVKVDIINGTL
ncbi:hypothetical protein BGW36DRAFT_426802 [Talaromyces proteolyticus]|uniref:Uncharacterized protein n=1 Tax=Talaromyces proteolyticus TaxID=1131652 RepID=A0AAD4KZ11_9EURO|nr:uncharacterized protein BGW36DRAFT_426802 [Talaromyces proteolyticus]KAH8699126.1 hypothetical protein BGW36DRAFT_426802 [Talaromyces proteolyticus]